MTVKKGRRVIGQDMGTKCEKKPTGHLNRLKKKKKSQKEKEKEKFK